MTGSYANHQNTLHINRRQGAKSVKPYYQKFHSGHELYLQFYSDSAVAIVLTSYFGNAQVETIAIHSTVSYGTTSIRYFTNFHLTLDGDYEDKKIWFKAVQGSDILTSEPILTMSLTDLISRGVIKYIKYTNTERTYSDLDNRFVDWSTVSSSGNFFDMFIEAIDDEVNDSDESEILEGSQNKTIISASYFSGRVLKTGGIPDYMVAKLGVASSLSTFVVNDIQYIKDGEITKESFGGSTLFQCQIKMTQKLAIGINVDNLGISETVITPPIPGTPMYVGSATSLAPDETEVKLIASVTASKTNQTKSYTITSARPCFAYPATFGTLTSILDKTGFEIISGFNVQTLAFTISGTSISYKIYTLKNLTTLTAYNITYKF